MPRHHLPLLRYPSSVLFRTLLLFLYRLYKAFLLQRYVFVSILLTELKKDLPKLVLRLHRFVQTLLRIATSSLFFQVIHGAGICKHTFFVWSELWTCFSVVNCHDDLPLLDFCYGIRPIIGIWSHPLIFLQRRTLIQHFRLWFNHFRTFQHHLFIYHRLSISLPTNHTRILPRHRPRQLINHLPPLCPRPLLK